MKLKIEVQIYDPRRGEDWYTTDFMTKRTFSSLKHGFFVMICVGPVDWTADLSLLNGSLRATSKGFFFMVDPWHPGASRLANALECEFGPLKEFEHSLCGYATIYADAVQQLLRLRTSFGGDTTGEWCIGGYMVEFSPPVRTGLFKRQLWDFSLVLEQADKVGCFLWLGEMQQSLFATRLFDGMDNLLRQSPIFQLATDHSTACDPHKR